MPSSISSSSPNPVARDEYWVRPMAERMAPNVGWIGVALIALLVIIAGIGAWEWTMRAAGLTTDIGDSGSAWARERRKVGILPDQAVIVGSSRLQFDIDTGLWTAATHIAPIQLSLRGTTPRPMIADLAHDPRFRGLLVVGYDPLVFFIPEGDARAVVAGAHNEPLFRRSGLWLYERLAGVFAYLDHDFRPISHIYRWPVPQRTQAGPFNAPWKMATISQNRETVLWDRIERDAPFRIRAEKAWMVKRGAPPQPASIDRMIAEVARNVRAIRARGGDVVFVRSPSDNPLLARENAVFPRARTWDKLLWATQAIGIYYADEPSLRAFHTVELSHLGRNDRGPFTLAVLRLIDRRLQEHGEHFAGLGKRE
jgi:hypothetical protein